MPPLAIPHDLLFSVTPFTPTTTPIHRRSTQDGFNPAAVISIVASITVIVTLIPLLALAMRRAKRKRCHEMLRDELSCKSSVNVREESLRRIVVTKEVERSSMAAGVEVPVKLEQAHVRDGGWSSEVMAPGPGNKW